MAVLPQVDQDELLTRAVFDQRMELVEMRTRTAEERMDRFENRLTRIEDKFDDRMHEFHNLLREQGRTFVLSMVGSLIAVGGLTTIVAAVLRPVVGLPAATR